MDSFQLALFRIYNHQGQSAFSVTNASSKRLVAVKKSQLIKPIYDFTNEGVEDDVHHVFYNDKHCLSQTMLNRLFQLLTV